MNVTDIIVERSKKHIKKRVLGISIGLIGDKIGDKL